MRVLRRRRRFPVLSTLLALMLAALCFFAGFTATRLLSDALGGPPAAARP